MAICLKRGADLHMAQLMPLPLTVSSFSKIQIGFTFLLPAHPGSPEQRAVKRVCACNSDSVSHFIMLSSSIVESVKNLSDICLPVWTFSLKLTLGLTRRSCLRVSVWRLVAVVGLAMVPGLRKRGIIQQVMDTVSGLRGGAKEKSTWARMHGSCHHHAESPLALVNNVYWFPCVFVTVNNRTHLLEKCKN